MCCTERDAFGFHLLLCCGAHDMALRGICSYPAQPVAVLQEEEALDAGTLSVSPARVPLGSQEYYLDNEIDI